MKIRDDQPDPHFAGQVQAEPNHIATLEYYNLWLDVKSHITQVIV